MKMQIERDPFGTLTFSGTVEAGDLVTLDLGPIERALLREVDEAADATMADYLLVLEMLFRRHQEQHQAQR